MHSYDMNGLELSPVSTSMNAYRLTAIDMTNQKYAAYAASKPSKKNEWAMHPIGLFKDPRDAAFVAQEFAKVYDKQTVRVMITDGTFWEVAREFRESIEIPEWKYPAEGLSFDEIVGGKYKTNYVNNAKDALVEAIKVFNVKPPVLAVAKKMMSDLEEMVKGGMTYREAAKKIVGG